MPAHPERRSPRLMGFDYSRTGAYFVTVNVDDLRRRFGEVVDGTLALNGAGTLMEECWLRIPKRFPTIELDAFVVMPNHFHGIVFITETGAPDPPSLSRVMQVFKSESTIAYRRGVRAGTFPPYQRSLWQRGFHDPIIRNAVRLKYARAYIRNNPMRWHEAHPGITG